MKRILKLAFAATLLATIPLHAQDLSGEWQGTLNVGKGLRTILKIERDGAGWKAMLYSIDQTPDGIAVSSISLDGVNLKFSIDALRATYEGKLSPDGNSIEGTVTQGRPMPLRFERATKETAWPLDSSPHKARLISVDNEIKIETLDWGGTGRPLVLLAGLGATAHVYDKFAAKLTPAYHVYGVTRRGFGASSAPAPANGNYASDRLGDDVLAVLDALKIERPILVGHSAAGKELSSIGSRYPSRVAGLVYLDAGFAYAFYDPAVGDLELDRADLRKELDALSQLASPPDSKPRVKRLLEVTLPRFEKDLRDLQKRLDVVPDTLPSAPDTAVTRIAAAIMAGSQKYTVIPCPVLAIFALPQNIPAVPGLDAPARAALAAQDLELRTAQSNAFEAGVPSARVVRLPNASHAVFLSNEADVLREMNAFIARLP